MRSRCGFEQASNLVGRQNARQLAQIIGAGQLVGEVDTAKCDGKEEAQRRGLRIHLRWLGAIGNLFGLEAADVIAGRRVRRAAEELGKCLDVADTIVLRLVAEIAVRHVG